MRDSTRDGPRDGAGERGVHETASTGAPRPELAGTFVLLSDTLVDDFDVADFLGMLTVRVVELTAAAEAGILLLDEHDTLQVMAASQERSRLLELFQLQHEEGPCLECSTTGRAIAVPDLTSERERWPRFAPHALEIGFHAVLAVPMRLRGRVLGALNLFYTAKGAIDAVDQALVQAFADVATIGLLQRSTAQDAQIHLGQVQHALQSRIVIEQAKGIVAEQASMSVDDAFERLRAHSRHHNRPLRELARAVIAGEVSAADLGA
jgi:GAF domain-containing protein